MRWCGRIALCGLVAALSAHAADAPDPLLKPVTPTGTQARVRLPTKGGFPDTLRFGARVPGGKNTGEVIDITVALDTQLGKSFVAGKTVAAWGYEVPPNREFVLPELLVPAAQVAPAVKKGGRDALVRLANVKLHVVEPPADAKNMIYQCTIALSASDLYRGGEKALEPRVSFADHFLELTVPTAEPKKTGPPPALGLKRPGTDDFAVPEATADATPGLVPVAAPTTARGGAPLLAYVAINGMDAYPLANKNLMPVNVSVSGINNWNTGVVITLGLARGCKVEFDENKRVGTGTGTQAQTEMVEGKIKELRIGLVTGPGLKAQKDLVLKDVPVVVDKSVSEGMMWVGPRFIDAHFKDAVYATGPDGVWKLHGRCSPDALADVKTRPKK
ncbi:MAG: hypothetical protein ACKODX_01850 [Gemmata sp.]